MTEIEDREQILALYRKMSDAMISKDTDTLRDIMGADTVVRHVSGSTETMDEWLIEIEREDMKYYSIDIRNIKINIDNDHAYFSSSNRIHARIYGTEGTWTIPGKADFIKKDGRWFMNHQ